MNTENCPKLSRRNAMLNAIQGAVVVSLVAAPMAPSISSERVVGKEPHFVPENDYPFFGGELPVGYEGGS